MNDFLPISRADMVERGWDSYDFLFITGDAYVDHPSFGTAILTRLLEKEGYRVCVCAQPDWHSAAAIASYGRPRLGVMISGGVIDSMVNHYTAAKKRRSGDVYSPGGKSGFRPDRCSVVYSNRVREAFGDIPIILGGTEGSLRRFAHYDYWSDSVRRSILLDSQADFISFGMGETSILQLASALAEGTPPARITQIHGTCYLTEHPPKQALIMPSFEEVASSKRAYAEAARIQHEEQDPIRGRILAQKHGSRYVVQMPLSKPLSQSEMDRVYALPYLRAWHPCYDAAGGIPALEEVKFSITSSRGCYGSCTFCALTYHQGRIVQSRSHASILREAEAMTWDAAFKGYIHDVGGPTANFRAPACKKQLKAGACRERQCLYPTICKNAEVTHTDYLSLLRKLRELPRVKRVFIRSGIRYDYLVADKDDTFFRELCAHHISGQLKVAPEHISPAVLKRMGKPGMDVYNRFADKFYAICREQGKEQYLVPYLMSSHPGSTLRDAVVLAEYLKAHRLRPEQVQDFYPTPGTLATAMFYTGLDPRTMETVYVPRTREEKAMQRALLQYTRPENYALVREALIRAKRTDLIGFGEHCLIRPPRNPNSERSKQYGSTDSGRQSTVRTKKGRAGRGGSGTERGGHSGGTGSHHRGR